MPGGGGGARSPDQDLDTISVRSDESGESSWDNEVGRIESSWENRVGKDREQLEERGRKGLGAAWRTR